MKDLVCKEPEKWTSPLPCGGGKCGKGESEQEGEYFSCKEESAHSFFRVKDLTHFGMRLSILSPFSS